MKPYFSKWGEERVDCSRLSGILLGRKIQKGEIFILSEIFPQGSTDQIVVSVCRLKLKKDWFIQLGKFMRNYKTLTVTTMIKVPVRDFKCNVYFVKLQ